MKPVVRKKHEFEKSVETLLKAVLDFLDSHESDARMKLNDVLIGCSSTRLRVRLVEEI